MTYLPPGTQIFIGPPASPMPAERVLEIGNALSKRHGIAEAYLPQVYCKGKFDPPSQVLVVVMEDGAPSQLQAIGEALHRNSSRTATPRRDPVARKSSGHDECQTNRMCSESESQLTV